MIKNEKYELFSYLIKAILYYVTAQLRRQTPSHLPKIPEHKTKATYTQTQEQTKAKTQIKQTLVYKQSLSERQRTIWQSSKARNFTFNAGTGQSNPVNIYLHIPIRRPQMLNYFRSIY